MKSYVSLLVFFISTQTPAAIMEKISAGTAINGWTQFTVEPSSSLMDTAILGNGFFPLLAPNGKIFYSRNLNLRLDLKGNLVSTDLNFKVLSSGKNGTYAPINLQGKGMKAHSSKPGLQATLTGFDISDSGMLEGLYSDGSSVTLAQLKLAIFQNQRKLTIADKARQLLQGNLNSGSVAFVSPGSYGAGILQAHSKEAIDDSYYLMNLDR